MPMLLAACKGAQQAGLSKGKFNTLTEEEADELEAIAARIIPTTDTPGAREAGVIYFIDNVLGDDREEELSLLQQGLRELKTSVVLSFGAAHFHRLEEAQQDQALSEIENTVFFDTIRYLTVAGMFSLPEYGGNRNYVGYDLIQFNNQHAWQPPFGYYDADYAEKGQ
jgi:gluconate 2-dehydrogenase gamma chain